MVISALGRGAAARIEAGQGFARKNLVLSLSSSKARSKTEDASPKPPLDAQTFSET